MWNLLIGAIFTIFVLVNYAPAATAQDVNNFKVSSFQADYHLGRANNQSSSLKVVEKLVVQFPNFDQNHGILRAIPTSYNNHTVSLNVESVENESGRAWSYSTYRENDNLVLKIGDADKFVQGNQTYVLTYTMRNITTNLSESDEFYWDVNGDLWPVNFEKVVARVHLDPDLTNFLRKEMSCFTGKFAESDSSNCSISAERKSATTTVTSIALNNLGPQETLTIVLSFEPGTFIPGPEISAEKRREQIFLAASFIAILLPPIIAGALMYNRWRKYGDDPKGRGYIVPEYEPPKNLSVLSSDFLLQQKLRSQAFSAAIIELAIAGHIAIHEIPKKGIFGKPDYEMELTKSVDKLSNEQKQVVEAVFEGSASGTLVNISHIKRSSNLRSDIAAAMNKLEDHLAEELHSNNFFVKNPKKIKRGYFIWASVTAAIGFGLLFAPYLFVIGIGLLLASGVIFTFSFYMPARTLDGVHAHDALLGLRDYIKLAEAERLKFGQSPEGVKKIRSGSFDPASPKNQIKLFESLLPYAMLFGLEKEWGKQFEGIYSQPPNWYTGHTSGFNAAYLGSSLSGFSSSSQTAFSAPSNSSGSGISSGSAGGGGGGGGGGGW